MRDGAIKCRSIATERCHRGRSFAVAIDAPTIGEADLRAQCKGYPQASACPAPTCVGAAVDTRLPSPFVLRLEPDARGTPTPHLTD
mmetsp:Transcript_61790/g.146086  ORF Transcript_61790/g.146086 Transcript_61790/m.146086 type:complete len:86 (+) Transcript_61790:1506-1763(+)